MEVYLDNSSTTRPYREVVDAMADTMYNNFGNPSSLHRRGIEAEKLIKSARIALAEAIKADPEEIFFTSGGTEADNLALRGAAAANRGRHIISTQVEHPAVLNTLESLKNSGFIIEYAPVNKNGEVDIERYKRLIRNDTILVTAMLVNNETGTIQPVEEMCRILKSVNPNAVFHIDAVQALGKIPFTVSSTGADMISLSSHKIHGPKGVGALYVRRGTRISPILFGGGQQGNLRPGTENVHGIYGFGIATEMATKDLYTKMTKVRALRNRLRDGIIREISDISVNTPENSAPHILNVSFRGTRSEVLLHTLENDGIYVSSGSACSSHKKGPSYVMTAIGLDSQLIDGTLRFSLSEFNTEEEIDYVLDRLKMAVSSLRKLMKFK